MKLAIADPPYLGRAHRWYGVNGGGAGYGAMRADEHQQAAEWDQDERHIALIRQLEKEYDGWAIAMSPHSLGVYAANVPLHSRSGYRFAAWVKPDGSVPSGSRINTSWEPVLFYIPKERRRHGSGRNVNDHISVTAGGEMFMGAKPKAWTRWVLDVLGFNESTDTVTDLFPGSGAVSAEINQGVLI